MKAENGLPICILTGAPGEDPDDCTTHAHAEEVTAGQPNIILLDHHSVPDGESVTPEEWIQRATLVLRQVHELAAGVFMQLNNLAPIMLQTEAGDLLMGVGLTLGQLTASGNAFMAKHGITPLDFMAEQRRVIAEGLAAPDCTEEHRARLNQFSAVLDEQEAQAASKLEEWTQFIRSESTEVH